MRHFAILLILILSNFWASAQTCQQSLGEATRAYHNGQLQQVGQILEPCLSSDEFEKKDKIEALKLMVNTKLLQNQDEVADKYLHEFLTLNPTYEIRDNDLAEFKNLYGTYDIRTKFSFGLSVGMVIPDYIILRHQSYSGQTAEPIDYEEINGISIGFTGEYSFVKNLFINASILYSQRSFKMVEEIMQYQKVATYERDQYLDIPIMLRYVFNFKKVKPYLGAGYALHYLIHSKGDIDHVPLAPPFPMVTGVPVLVDNYDLTDLRTKFSHNWLASAGIIVDFKHSLLELRISYELGLNNQIQENERHKNRELVETFAYIPDDYRVNSWIVSLVFSRNILKPYKKKP